MCVRVVTVCSTCVCVRCKGVFSRSTYKLEAAADAGLDVAAPEGGHLPQLPRDLDGVVEEEPQAPLVTEARGAGHLAEQD